MVQGDPGGQHQGGVIPAPTDVPKHPFRDFGEADVRFGSEADIGPLLSHVRFNLKADIG
jgi:hypothetical protein